MEFALGTLRLSVGRRSTPAEIDTAADLIVAEAKKQKQQ
jgi:cysteine sulfinate desulfinase/cysteine desulfurase-like protein